MIQISDGWKYQGFEVVRMENEFVRLELMPEWGGKIWSIEFRPTGRQFLWHHPRHDLRALPVGANYDDHFFGGFDELLPNDAVEIVGGESLVDHGELWTTRLRCRVEERSVIMEGALPITPLYYRKAVRLVKNRIELKYELRNIGRRRLDLLWKLHPALRISPGAEIEVPAGRARVADPNWSRVQESGDFDWEEKRELQVVPEFGETTEFLYLLGLRRGECGVRHRDENWSFRMRFSKEIFSSVWLFASYGGWRNLEVLILEPCTAPELSLAACAKTGRCLRLEAGASIQAEVEVEVADAKRGLDPFDVAGAT